MRTAHRRHPHQTAARRTAREGLRFRIADWLAGENSHLLSLVQLREQASRLPDILDLLQKHIRREEDNHAIRNKVDETADECSEFQHLSGREGSN